MVATAMIRVVVLALVALVLSACAMPARISFAPQTPYTTPGTILPSEGVIGRNSQILASPTVGQLAARATVAPSATPDAGATQAADNRAGERAHDAAVLAQKQADAQKAESDRKRIDSQNTQSAFAISASFTRDWVALQSQRIDATQRAASATETQAAPAQVLEAARDYERAKWAWLEAITLPMFYFLAGVGMLLIGVAFVLAMHRPHVTHVEQAEPKRDYPGTAFHPVIPVGTSLVRRETPPGWTDEEMALFALNVRTSRNKTGIPFTRAWWVDKNGMPDKRWDSLNIYLGEHDYILAATDAANSTASFTPDGERYLTLFESSPLPPTEENPLSA